MVFLILLFSCKKEKMRCNSMVYYEPVEIAFKGFDQKDLKEVVVVQYQKNNRFDTVVKRDTFDYSGADFVVDSAFKIYTSSYYLGLFTLQMDYDYTITIPAKTHTFTINDIREGDTLISWEAERCSSGDISPTYLPWHFNLNGKDQTAFGGTGHHFVLFLVRN